MNQPLLRPGQPQAPYPPKTPHLYNWQILTALVSFYLLSFILVGVGTGGTNAADQNKEPALLYVLSMIGSLLLLGIHGFLLLTDRRNFFTLNGNIRWKQMSRGLRVTLICVYCSFWIMPAIYLALAVKHAIEVRQITKATKSQMNSGYTLNKYSQIQSPGTLATLSVPVSSNTRAIIKRLLRIVLYCVGIFVAELGIFGIGLYAFNDSSPMECIGGFLGLALAGIGLLVFFRQGYHRHGLHWTQYLWWILGTTAGGFILLFLAFGFTSPGYTSIGNTLGAIIITLYGIALAWIAYLQPPLRQQIAERVPLILHAIPTRQLPLAELIFYLQNEYKCSTQSAYQCLSTLDYLEQIDIPGLPMKMCQMKRPKESLEVSQRPTLIMHALNKEAPGPLPPPTSARATPTPAPTPMLKSPQNMPVSSPVQALPRGNIAQPAQLIPQATPVAPHNQSIAQAPGNGALGNGRVSQLVVATPAAPREEKKAVKVFYCYAHEDKHLRDQLDKHLSPLKRLGQIISWYDKELQAGTEWEKEIEKQITTANIILLLISPDFISSDYCYSVEMQKALDMHQTGQARVIPVILRPVDWESTPIKKLQVVPANGKPITTWSNRDQAYKEVAQRIRTVVEMFLTPPQQPKIPGPVVNNPKLPRAQQPSANHPQAAAEVELIRARCKQGKLIITNTRIIIELSGFGQPIKSQMLLRTSLSSLNSKLAVAPVFGAGGGINLTFHGRGKEQLNADLVPIKEANVIIALLGQQ